MRSRFRGRRAERGDDELIEQFFGDKDAASHPDAHRKAKQLCREVYRVLAESVTTAEIVEVRPAPDTARLAVAVRPWPGDDPTRTLDALAREKGKLRAEIAAALQRKRTPDLFFEVVP
jgi:ribosome-binding factor A